VLDVTTGHELGTAVSVGHAADFHLGHVPPLFGEGLGALLVPGERAIDVHLVGLDEQIRRPKEGQVVVRTGGRCRRS
jgi:hypothetical protein